MKKSFDQLNRLAVAVQKTLRAPCDTQSSSVSGMTLIEMLIVITLIGIVMGLVGLNVTKRLDEGKQNTTIIQMKQLGNALDDFRRVCGFYPTTEQGLDALVKAPAGRECKGYDPEGFLKTKKVPMDAWNHDFIYSSDGNKYVIKSLGNDGAEGGEGIAKDLSTEDLN